MSILSIMEDVILGTYAVQGDRSHFSAPVE